MKYEIDFDDKEAAIVEDYLKDRNQSISQVARQAILEMIFDDDYCLSLYEKAMEEYKKNPTTFTLEEVKTQLGMA